MKKTLKTGLLAVTLVAALAGAASAAPVINLADAVGDDIGPGTYQYPTNGVFTPGAFDLKGMAVESVGNNVVFTIELNQETIDNAWGGPNGISTQMFHIYVDNDPTSPKGFSESVPGPNITFDKPWKKAILCEGGWGTEVEDQISDKVDVLMQPAIFLAKNDGDNEPVKVDGNKISITVPKSFVGEPSAKWGIQAFVMGQEGNKDVMSGVKVRKAQVDESEWQFFGAKDDSPALPYVIDMFTPTGVDQKTILSSYNVKTEALAKVPMIYGK